jgi:hypothetical protein
MNAIRNILRMIWAKIQHWRGTDEIAQPRVATYEYPPVPKKLPERKAVEVEAAVELSGPQPSEFVIRAWEEAEVEIEVAESEPVEVVEEVPEAPLLEPSEFVRRVWMADELDKILESPNGKGKKPRIQHVGIVMEASPTTKPKKPTVKPEVKKKPVRTPAPAKKKPASPAPAPAKPAHKKRAKK